MIDKNTVFISHITEDKDFAKNIKDWLDQAFLNAVNFFVSTDNSSMPIGREWANEIRIHLEKASMMFVIISELSVERKWLYFESGAAYIKNIPVIPICVNGYKISKLLPPLSFFQGIELPNERDETKLLEMLAKEVGLYVPKPPFELKLIERHSQIVAEKGEIKKTEKDIALDSKLTKRACLNIINSLNQDIVNTINELLFAINLNYIEYESDYETLLNSIEKEFSTNRLMSKTGLKELITQIKLALTAFKPKKGDDEYDSGYKKADLIKKIALKQLPSKQDCKERILNYPPDIWLPILAYKHYFGYTFEAEDDFKEEMFDFIIDKEFGVKILPIIEDVLLKEEPENDLYNKLIVTTRAILGKEFENWFINFKGMSYDDEIKKYNELAFAKRERAIKEEQLDLERRKIHLEREKLRNPTKNTTTRRKLS